MSIESVPVSNIMVKKVKTGQENQSINTIAKVMSDNNIGSVVIVKGNGNEGLAGIITERDIVRVVGAEHTEYTSLSVSASAAAASFQLLARDIMSKPVITIDATS